MSAGNPNVPNSIPFPVGVVQAAQVILTSAQILALNGAPVSIVPAPGPGKTIIPIAFVLNYVFSGTGYTATGNFFFALAGQIITSSITTPATNINSTADSNIIFGTLSGGAQNTGPLFAPDITNVPLTFSTTGANPTGGNGLMVITLIYYVANSAFSSTGS